MLNIEFEQVTKANYLRFSILNWSIWVQIDACQGDWYLFLSKYSEIHFRSVPWWHLAMPGCHKMLDGVHRLDLVWFVLEFYA